MSVDSRIIEIQPLPPPNKPAAAKKVNQEDDADADITSPYLQFLTKLRQKWVDAPDVFIQYQNLAYTVSVPRSEKGVVTVAGAALNMVKSLIPGLNNSSKKFKKLSALAEATGVIRPGTLTLVLAPPGHGKSTLLRALSGRLSDDARLTGSVTYNGLTANQALQNGVHVSRLAAYVAQNDLHFPTLTVQETLSFAAQNSIPHSELLGDPQLIELDNKRAEMMMDLIGLTECKDTIIGNDLLRGISGGQRRRVTIAEMLITNAKAFFLDEPTTGLDAAVSYHLFHSLRSFARIGHASIVAALLQPSPELYGLFDDVILMREGHIVYHGARQNVSKWFSEWVGIDIPSNIDEANFIVDWLTDSKLTYKYIQEREFSASNANGARSPTTRTRLNLQVQSVKDVNIRLEPTKPIEIEEKDNSNNIEKSEGNVVVFHLPGEDHGKASDLNKEPGGTAPSVDVEMAPTINISDTKPIAFSTQQLLAAFHESPYHGELHELLEASIRVSSAANDSSASSKKQVDTSNSMYRLNASEWSPYTRAQYGEPYPRSNLSHTQLQVSRQAKLTARNRSMVRPRIGQAVFLGIIYCTLFYQLDLNDFQSKFGLILYIIMFGAFANLPELPVADEAKNVVAKQIDAGFFPTSSYVFANLILSLPLIITETLIFGILMYWVSAFAPDGDRFFFFLLLMFVSENAMSVFMRSLSYIAPNPDVARQMDLPFIILFTIFSGFLIPYNKIPTWLIWVFWISPFGWALRSFAINEFGADRYDYLVTGDDGSMVRAGWYYMDKFDTYHDFVYKWTGLAYLIGFFLLFVFVGGFFLSKVKPRQPLGTKRIAIDSDSDESDHVFTSDSDKDTGDHSPNDHGDELQKKSAPINEIAIRVRQANAATSVSSLPFSPMTLSWRHIHYTVFVGESGKEPRKLLQDISGFALPGTLTALMGASGAGKTTLMDVIAGRKTVGVIEGDILVNGHPKDPSTYGKISGYVEQNDIHIGTATVREALHFSAKLRLPSTVSEIDRTSFVNEVMDLIGLTPIADRMIGDAALVGLSPGQLKLVTIGVELVANPSILFLDEPTSGLDAPAAYRVMKAVRRIAATGRTVLCTIHQPSQQLFEMFDRLLLLKSGGEEVYFGDLGRHSSILIDYFENIKGKDSPTLPQGQNPANWMLDVIGAAGSAASNGSGSGSGGAAENPAASSDSFAALWRDHQMRERARVETEKACTPAPDSSPYKPDHVYASSWTRYYEVQKRYFQSHWRNPPVNLTRWVLLTITGLLLGIVYYQIDENGFAGATSLYAVISLSTSFPPALCAGAAAPSFFRQRAVYYREKTIGMYGYLIHSTCMGIVEVPYIFIAVSVCLALPFYFMVGLRMDVQLFFQFVLVVFLQALVMSGMSQFFTATMPNVISANILNGTFISLFFMFGGVFKHPSVIPSGWKWFYYIDPNPKSLLAVALRQFECNGSNCPKINKFQSSYAYIEQETNSTADDYWKWIGWLILTVAVFRLMIIMGFRFVSHIKR